MTEPPPKWKLALLGVALVPVFLLPMLVGTCEGAGRDGPRTRPAPISDVLSAGL
ncbi:MAG: hypothetical protein U0263_24300 [Polyangiaceae bacterium]